MDAATKIFIFIFLLSLLIGTIVLILYPEYRINKIYLSNKSYYPQITEEIISKEIKQIFRKREE